MSRRSLLISVALVLSVIMAGTVTAEERIEKYYVGKVVALDALKNTLTINEYNSNSPMKFFLHDNGLSGNFFIGDEVVITAGVNDEILKIQMLDGSPKKTAVQMIPGRAGAMPGRSSEYLDPFEEMSRMQKIMNRMFNDSFSRGSSMDGGIFGSSLASFDPAIDVKDQDAAYIVVVDLPGVDKDTIDISAEPNSVTISGERTIETREQDDVQGFYRSERSFGSFHRTIPLIESIIPGKVTAETDEGVLIIKLPKEKQGSGLQNKSMKIKVQ